MCFWLRYKFLKAQYTKNKKQDWQSPGGKADLDTTVPHVRTDCAESRAETLANMRAARSPGPSRTCLTPSADSERPASAELALSLLPADGPAQLCQLHDRRQQIECHLARLLHDQIHS